MQAGAVLRDKYELVASIGRGGMGEVFHAIHLPSGTDVALKVVNREIVDDTMMARLEREAAAATRIQSPYVPRLLDVDRSETGELFLVMERLMGETLSERLKRGGVLSWEEVYNIGDNVLRGLIDAHDAGVIHRDLKPGNIFIEHLDGGLARARILDFGVCKLDEGDTQKLTVTGESVGTIAYMAPEQIRGASKVDERADLYSFAMIVYEAVSGRIPYEAQGQMALLATKLERPARPLRGLNLVPVPSGLDGLLVKALSRRPSERPANGREMLRMWQALGGATVQPPPPPPPATVASPSSPPTQVVVTAGARTSLAAPAPRRSLWMLGAAAAAIAVLTAGLLARRAREVPAVEASAPEVPAAAVVATGPVLSAPPPTTAPIGPVEASPPAQAAAASLTPPASALSNAPPASVPTGPVVAPPPPVEPAKAPALVELDDPSKRARPTPAVTRPAAKPAPVAKVPTVAPPPPPAPPRGKGPTLVEQPRY